MIRRNELVDIPDEPKRFGMPLYKADEYDYFSNLTAFSNAFIGWNYNVLTEDLHTCSLAEGRDYVADKMHDVADQKAIEALDKILIKCGAERKMGDPNEGPSVRYFCRKSSIPASSIPLAR